MAYLGRKGAVAPLTSADIPAGIVEGTDIAFLENASGTQNLSGTYSTERMYLNDSYTLTGDVTVTGHLALGSIADADVVITQDSTERTITGSGTLESGDLLHRPDTSDLTGMTGELGSVVTGSPNLNLSNSTFPTGSVLQVVTKEFRVEKSYNATSFENTFLYGIIIPKSVSSKIWIQFITLSGNNSAITTHYSEFQIQRTISGSNFVLIDDDGGTSKWQSDRGYYMQVPLTVNKTDFPATTSEVQYMLQIKRITSSINYIGLNGTVSFMSLTEIAG